MSTVTLGVDVGGTKIRLVRLEDGRHVTHEEVVPLPDDGVLETVAQLVAAAGGEGAAAVGVGVAGLVRWPQGEFVWGPHVSGEAVPYRRSLQERLRLPVVVDNDANAAAVAEWRLGAARGYRHALVLTFGTGIGAGIVADGALYRGASFAGEVGHMIMAPEGRRCACGQRGCWETLVSGSRLDQLAAELLTAAPDGTLARVVAGEIPTGRHLVAAAEAGDAAARSVLAEAGRWLGRGVANLVAVLDPEVVVVGGAVAQAGDLLLEPARSQIPSVLEGSAHRPPVSLLPAALGPSAGAVGAALLALDQLTSPSEAP